MGENESFERLLKYFYETKQKADDNKKVADTYNKQIKDEMNKMNITEFEGNELTAKITISKKESFIEEKLINKLKELGQTDAIKTKEYIDYDELENVIYNGKLNASNIADCRESKEIVTLRVTERKN